MDIDMNKMKVESLNLARRIGMFNSETIYYIKNSLTLMDTLKQKELNDKYEKFEIIIKTTYPHTIVELILANSQNPSNHNITLLDIDLIQESLLEGLKQPEQGEVTLQ